MSSSKLHTLHKQLLSAFTSQPSDLKTSGRLLAELKVRLVCFSCVLSFRRRERLPQVVLIETGLIFPQGDYSTKDLVIAREYRACFTHTDQREVLDIANNNNRRDSRDRSILEHTDESGTLVRPVLFSTTDVLQRLQVSCCLPSTVNAFVAYTVEKNVQLHPPAFRA